MKLPFRLAKTAVVLLAAALAVPAAYAGETKSKSQGDEDRHVDRRVLVAERMPGHHMFQFPLGRGYLGIVTTWLTPELRTHFGAPEDAGVLVGQVAENSPADKAGLQVGDVLVAVNGEHVESAGDVMVGIRKLEAGDAVSLEIRRDGRAQTLSATIEERDREQVDLGELMHWRTHGGEGGPEAMFLPRMHHGELMKTLQRVPPDTFVRLGDSLKAIDWGEIAERTGRSTEDLERRLGDLEKRLADLQKRLEQATRDDR